MWEHLGHAIIPTWLGVFYLSVVDLNRYWCSTYTRSLTYIVELGIHYGAWHGLGALHDLGAWHALRDW